jgi:hypothetical protein
LNGKINHSAAPNKKVMDPSNLSDAALRHIVRDWQSPWLQQTRWAFQDLYGDVNRAYINEAYKRGFVDCDVFTEQMARYSNVNLSQ